MHFMICDYDSYAILNIKNTSTLVEFNSKLLILLESLCLININFYVFVEKLKIGYTSYIFFSFSCKYLILVQRGHRTVTEWLR